MIKVARYSKTCQKKTGVDNFRYQFLEEIRLTGEDGYLQSLLKPFMQKHQNEPYYWHINMNDSLNHIGYPQQTLVIRTTLGNGTTQSLFEIVNIWGRSSHSWTQVLIHLCGLLVPEDLENEKAEDKEKDFELFPAEMDDPIFAISHFLGSTVENGKFIGDWVFPSSSLTLLWPETVEYFFQQINCIPRNNSYF